jgi:hypothetical protein
VPFTLEAATFDFDVKLFEKPQKFYRVRQPTSRGLSIASVPIRL